MKKQMNIAIKFMITGLVLVIGLLFMMGFTEYKISDKADPMSVETNSVYTLNSTTHNGWGASSSFK